MGWPLDIGRPPAGGSREDWLLAATIGLALGVEIAVTPGRHGPLVLDLAAAAIIAAPLGRRRHDALLWGAVTLVALFATSRAITPMGNLVTPLAISIVVPYSIAAHSSRRAALAGLLLSLVGCSSIYPLDASDPGALLALVALIGASWAAGRAVRHRNRMVGELHESALAAEHDSAQRQAAVVAHERARVARELHDVVAHSMTVVVLQAEAAQRVWHTEPDRARESLAAVSAVSRDTLAHLRTTLSVLGAAEHPPLPQLADVEGLLCSARSSGLRVQLSIEGRRRALPSTVELAAYRLLQEALTNATRHAAPTDVLVHLGYGPAELSLEVTDSGRQGDVGASVPGAGHGLRGMRERVEACGGRLRAEPVDGGGFTVSARLPLNGAAA